MAEVNGDEATVAAALTAGLDEYNMIGELGGEILAASEATLAAGDADTARGIAETLYGYSELLQVSSPLAVEQLATVDLENRCAWAFWRVPVVAATRSGISERLDAGGGIGVHGLDGAHPGVRPVGFGLRGHYGHGSHRIACP